jgi:hypothetical protein
MVIPDFDCLWNNDNFGHPGYICFNFSNQSIEYLYQKEFFLGGGLLQK